MAYFVIIVRLMLAFPTGFAGIVVILLTRPFWFAGTAGILLLALPPAALPGEGSRTPVLICLRNN